MILLLSFLGLVSCSSLAVTEVNLQPSETPTRSETAISAETIQATATAPFTTKGLNFESAPGVTISPDQFPAECGISASSDQTAPLSMKGLTVYDSTNRELRVLSDSWAAAPTYIIRNDRPDSNFVAWSISPDGLWIAYIDSKRADDFDIWVENVKSSERITKHVDGMTKRSGMYWGSDEHLVIPLLNEGDEFEWIVWKPFVNEERRIGVTVPGGEELVKKYSLYPEYNPQTDTVISLCQQCEKFEFQVISVKNNNDPWYIDFGSGIYTSPKWGPTTTYASELITFYFGLNKMWIINGQGDSLVKLVLPYRTDEGWPVKTYRWSHDGKKLAMIRDRSNSLLPYLTIFALEDYKIINFCDDIPYGSLMWSSNNQSIAVLSHRTGDQLESTLVIVSVESGQSEKITLTENISMIGWAKP